VRIVAGRYGGRRLTAPKGMATRPTADRVREALFSILFDVQGLAVLDLFAGTGAIGLEALSRGARHATFVENDKRALAALEKNLVALAVPEEMFEIVERSVDRALADLIRRARKLDLVFADPPYEKGTRVLPSVLGQSAELLAAGGRIVLEHASTDSPPSPPAGLQMTRTKMYGETALAFYARSADGGAG
jgi:16S rRNA (guanine966-N2)-methyltransferase